MALYCAIYLHSNNNVLVIIDENDRIILEKKLPNEINIVLKYLAPNKSGLFAVAVESTFNWYWFVDGLNESGYKTVLVNTAAVEQYSGKERTNDKYDAFWLAHLMRLNILPTGYIYPKEERAIRDLLRKRMQLVRNKTAQVLSIQNQYWRNTGRKLIANDIQSGNPCFIEEFSDTNIKMALYSNWHLVNEITITIKTVEKTILSQVKLRPEFEKLTTVSGIGTILALTIMLEIGDIKRFKSVGNFASYCRCVDSKKISNKKKKGEGNRKNCNRYLAWAFIEAANHCKRWNDKAKKFHQKKLSKTKNVIATKALAHKLARACYYVMRDQVDFDEDLLFS